MGGIAADSALAILHVEDNPDIRLLVRNAFESFGFRGQWFSCTRVVDALDLLGKLERRGQPLHLILLDMHLPDGLGLDILRAVKQSARWRVTPVIALSGESDRELVNAAYALGTGCFLSKLPSKGTMFDSLEALYRCWLDGAVWPHNPSLDPLQTILARGVQLRAQTAELYLNVARQVPDTEDAAFWLNRSLTEGNMSNLLAFIQPLATERDAPQDLLERISGIQDRIQRALQRVETFLRASDSPQPAEICRAAVEVISELDEEAIIRLLSVLLPLTPEAVSALRESTAQQFNALAAYARKSVDDPVLLNLASKVDDLARHLRQTESVL